MDLDNITDIEILREEVKRHRVQMKCDVNAEGENFIFRKGFWYNIDQDECYITIYSDDYKHKACFTYDEAHEYL